MLTSRSSKKLWYIFFQSVFSVFSAFWKIFPNISLFLFFEIHYEQDNIPLGCMLPTSVTTTRCQHWGSLLRGECTFQRMHLSGVVPSRYTPAKRAWKQAYPSPPEGTRHTLPTPSLEGTSDQAYLLTDRMTDTSKTLPSLNIIGGR